MESRVIRPSGLQPLDDVPWGTHICSFYDTKDDLLDLLVPYFASGLGANEQCVWITSTPITVDEAAQAMREAIEDFDRMQADGRMMIIPHDEWYLEDGVFDMNRVLAAWARTVDDAVANGYDGVRVSGNTAWLEQHDWEAFAEYERTIDGAVEDSPILVL